MVSTEKITSTSQFKKWAAFLWFYTLIVVLWGAWVRISKSGNGCGDHWPLCQGQLLPSELQMATWIEFTHRMMSGFYGFLVIGLWFYSRKIFIANHPARRRMTFVLFFMITEALLGAKLVLAGLTGENQSLARAGVMSLHMVNSLLLTASTVLLWVSSEEKIETKRYWGAKQKTFALITGLFFLLIATSGAMASLSSTLYPSENLLKGFADDWSSHSPLLLRLRFLHPLFATLLGGLLALETFKRSHLPTARVARSLIIFGIVFGILTLLWLAPVWMKLTHLALAHVIWSVFILLNLESASEAQSG